MLGPASRSRPSSAPRQPQDPSPVSPWGSDRAGAKQVPSTTQPCSDGCGRSSQGTVSPQVSGGLLGDPGSQGLTRGTRGPQEGPRLLQAQGLAGTAHCSDKLGLGLPPSSNHRFTPALSREATPATNTVSHCGVSAQQEPRACARLTAGPPGFGHTPAQEPARHCQGPTDTQTSALCVAPASAH